MFVGLIDVTSHGLLEYSNKQAKDVQKGIFLKPVLNVVVNLDANPFISKNWSR